MNKTLSTSPLLASARLDSEKPIYMMLGLLIVTLWIPRLQGPIDLRWDAGTYYVLGTSIAEGKGYRLLNEPNEIQANQYPPLFPLIIAAHQLVLGTSDPVVVGRLLRLSAFLIFSAFMFSVYVFLRQHLARGHAFFGTLVCLLSVHTYFMSDLCFPDILYSLLAGGFLLASSGRIWFLPARWAGVLGMAAFMSRTAGIALLAAWVGEALVKKEWKTVCARALLTMIPVVGWFSYVHHVETSAEYKHPAYAYQRADYMFYNVSYARNVSLNDPFDPALGYSTVSELVGRFVGNLSQITRFVGESVSSNRRAWEVERETVTNQFGIEPGPLWLIDVPLFALGCLVLLGVGRLAIEGHLLIVLCVCFSIAIVCLTPWPGQFNRYLMPTVPLLSLCLFKALGWMLERSSRASEKWRGAGSVLVCLIIIGIALQQVATAGAIYTKRLLPVQYQDRQGTTVEYHLFFYVDSYRALDSGVDWLLAHAKSDDVIAVSMPHWVYLRTGNKTVMPPFESDPRKAQQLLESVPISYLVIDEGVAVDSKRFTKGVIESFPDRWNRVYSDDIVTETGERREQAFEIYQRVDPGFGHCATRCTRIGNEHASESPARERPS